MASCDVLVVGGGLAGLTSAVFLASSGVRVTLVEEHLGTLIHPRARTINPRTAEVLRQAGLEREIAEASSYVRELPSVRRLRAHTLAAPEDHVIEERPPVDAAGGYQVSPSRWAMIDQDRLEGLLLRRARELGAEVRFGTRLETFTQDAAGVRARLTGPGGPAELDAAYLVGADGYGSRVRELCDVAACGPGRLGRQVSMVFEADLSGVLRGRHDPENGRYLGVAHLEQPRPGTVLSPYGQARWVLYTPYDPERDGPISGFGAGRCTEIIRAAAGSAEVTATIVPQLADGTRVLSYETAAYVADRFRVGRVFLAGDAAHAMPPAGAFGAGTGIQDAHNLAWRLAFVLRGDAGEGLLEGYESERRPVAWFTLGQALRQMRQFNASAPRFPEEGPVVEYDAVVFGYRYDAGTDGPPAYPPRELRGQVGTRAPHVAVGSGSTLDWYGRELVLVSAQSSGTEPSADWTEVARTRLRVRSLADAGPDAAAAHGLPPGGALLVRPDGFVWWHCAQSAEPLANALRRVLDRHPVTASQERP